VISSRYAATLQWISILLTVCGLLVIVRRLPLEPALALLEARVGELGLWGPLLFGLFYAVAVLLLLPSWLLTMAAGALFGLVLGTVVVSLASTTGAALAFLIARRLARDGVQQRLGNSPRLQALDQAIREGGWKIVVLLRLSPAVPFTLQNYFYGLTALRFGPCILASWLAMLPGTFLYVYLGHVSRLGLEAAVGAEHARSPAEWALLIVGLLCTFTVIVYVTRLAWRVLRERAVLPESAPPQPAMDNERGAPAWAWVTILWAVVALVMLVVAVWAWLNPEAFQQRICELIGVSCPAKRGARP
jgi:uncharacterized membrane protein YdjX (TVP38/TMEM64 family)